MKATPLTDTQRAQLRDVLEQRKEQLLQELDLVQRDTLSVASTTSHGDAEKPGSPRDQANQIASNMVRDAEAARDHDELVGVRAALERMDEGSYGECIDCGMPVGAARLLAQPFAARCIGCQSKAEEAQQGRR